MVQSVFSHIAVFQAVCRSMNYELAMDSWFVTRIAWFLVLETG